MHPLGFGYDGSPSAQPMYATSSPVKIINSVFENHVTIFPGTHESQITYN